MKVKQVLKTICFMGVCVAVGSLLYSHMHMDYPLETDKNNLAAEEVENVAFPKTYQKTVSDLLRFDVVINTQADPQEFYAATATRAHIDAEAAYELFMSQETAVEHSEQFFTDTEGDKVAVDFYETDERSLSLKKQSFIYFDNRYRYVINSFFIDESADEYNAYLYSTESDLDFADRQEAWTELKEALEKLGLDMSTALKVATYSLDWETMEKEEECIDVNGNEVAEEKNPNWSKEDDGYYYYITQDNQGTPFYLYDELQSDKEYEVPLEVFQRDEGIIFAYLERWFDIEISKERLALKSFDDIMAVIEEKYSDTIRTNPLTVERATLYTFPMKMGEDSYQLIPVWICSIAEKFVGDPENIYTSYLYMGINAVTGEEL